MKSRFTYVRQHSQKLGTGGLYDKMFKKMYDKLLHRQKCMLEKTIDKLEGKDDKIRQILEG